MVLSKIEELKLISQCVLLDDRHAFGKLVDAYQSEIRRFFLNLTLGDEALSDDLAQETFIKAYTNIRSFKGMARFRTWLYRIAYNEYYSWMRKRKEERIVAEGNCPEEEVSNEENRNDAAMDVYSCMRVLSEIERTIISLFYIEDQPIKKIAEITLLPEGTIKSHLSRAKVKMAQEMES